MSRGLDVGLVTLVLTIQSPQSDYSSGHRGVCRGVWGHRGMYIGIHIGVCEGVHIALGIGVCVGVCVGVHRGV